MKYRIQTTLYHLTILLESVIGIFLILGVVFAVLGLARSLNFLRLFLLPEQLTNYLSLVATIVLSIEFTKMLCTHSLDSVVEVLSMAIAREIIAHETTAVENLLGVVAIAILFIVRKHCYVPKLDERHETATRSLFRDTIDGWRKRAGVLAPDSEEHDTAGTTLK